MATLTLLPRIEKSQLPFIRTVCGFFPFSTVNVNSHMHKTITAGSTVTFTSDTAGVAGDLLKIAVTANGSAKASINFTTAGCTKLDSVMEFKTGGTGGNSWKVDVVPRPADAHGVVINEDTIGKVLTIMYETAVSTVLQVETAVAGTTNFAIKTTGTAINVLAAATDTIHASALSGGTAATYVTWSATAPHLTVSFTTAVTTVTAMNAAINTTATNKCMTASGGTGIQTWVTGDAFAADFLAGGVSAVALNSSLVVGTGFTIARSGASGTGEYTMTFNDQFNGCISKIATIQQATATSLDVQIAAYTVASKTLVFRCVNNTGIADPVTGASCGIFFYLKMLA